MNSYEPNSSNIYGNKSNDISDKIFNFETTKNIGFTNIGHTCYMNSFLQILLHTPTFLPKLKELYYNKIGEDTLIYNLIKLSEYPHSTIYLREIKRIISKPYPKYGLYTQNDTQNFAVDFLDTLISEIKNETSFISESNDEDDDNFLINNINDNIAYKKKIYRKFLNDCEKSGEKTFIEDLFLLISSKIKYNGELVQKNGVRLDLLFFMELTFPQNKIKEKYSLRELMDLKYNKFKKISKLSNSTENSDANNKKRISNQTEVNNNPNSKINEENWLSNYLKAFFNSLNIFRFFNCCERKKIYNENKERYKEVVNKINSLSCVNAEKKIEQKVLLKIVFLPKILIISFVRGIEGKNLITSTIQFEEELDLKDYIDYDLFNNNLGTRYRLFAVNCRVGSTKTSGHCFSYIKIINDWVCFNDKDAHMEKPKLSLDSVVGLYYYNEDIKK